MTTTAAKSRRTEAASVKRSRANLLGISKSEATYMGIRLELLEEHPHNPRRTFSDLDDLAASIQAHGLLEPLVVREAKERTTKGEQLYQIVCGARRKRAAEIAGLKQVPCRVIVCDDAATLELMLVENSQRVDVDPFEEAAAIESLCVRHKRDAGDIAERLGRSAAWVRRRLLLATAPDYLQDAYRLGRVSLGGVLRLQTAAPDVRQKVFDSYLSESRSYRERRFSTREIADFILTYTRRLDGAPWDRHDASLPGGACRVCPRRTGAQVEIWDESDTDDRCLDQDCWSDRLKVWQERAIERAETAGGPVVRLESAWSRERGVLVLGEDELDEEALAELGVQVGADEELPTIQDLVDRKLLQLEKVGVVVVPPAWAQDLPKVKPAVSVEDLAAALEAAGAPKAAAQLRTEEEDEAHSETEREQREALWEARRERDKRNLEAVRAAFGAADVDTKLAALLASSHTPKEPPKTTDARWARLADQVGLKYFLSKAAPVLGVELEEAQP